MTLRWFLLCVAAALLASGADAARLLGVFPFDAPSHFQMYGRLLKVLADRGHHVTVLSHFPQQEPHPNYTDIAIADKRIESPPFLTVDDMGDSEVAHWGILWGRMNAKCRQAYAHPATRRLLDSGEKFDLVFAEVFAGDCMAGVAHHFGAPLVGLVSSTALPWVHDRMGNPDNPAYMENYFLPLVAPFDFKDRLMNSVYYVYLRLQNWWYSSSVIDAIERANLRPDAPPTSELVFNTSLILLNSHFSLTQPIPLVPGVVEIGGLHIAKPKRLSKELEKFVSGSSHGVILFSMGTMVRSESFSPSQLRAIFDVFGSLPQRVLWKVNATGVPPLPDNVLAVPWLPQNDILNDPRTRLFITHGGLFSVQEAVAAGVPMLVMPTMGDQYFNARKLEKLGVARRLFPKQLQADAFRTAINDLINTTSYSEKTRQLSKRFFDRRRTPMDEAVHWVEYVLRHEGAPHLRSAALDLAWYQYLLLDILAFVIGCLALAVGFVFVVTRWAYVWLTSSTTSAKKLKKN